MSHRKGSWLRRRWIVTPLFGIFLLSACSGTPLSTQSTSGSPVGARETVKVSTDFLLWGWHSPLFAAKAEKFFDEQNLEVTIQAGKGSVDVAAQLGAGAVDFALVDISTALVAISKGADIKLVGVHLERHPGGLLYIEQRTSIKTWKDIEGKKIGGASGDAYFVVLPGLMKDNGADPSKYTIVTMEGSATTGALISGRVDAIPGSPMTAPPRAAAAAKEGLTLSRFGYADNGYKAVGFAIATTGKMYKNKPDVVQRFVNAWAKATLWSEQNPDKAVGDFLAANPDKQKDPETQSLKASFPLIKAEDGTYFKFEPDRLQLNIDNVNANYNASLKINDVYTNEFVDKLPAGYTEGKLS